MESDLVGKKVRWRVSTAAGLVVAEATVTEVKERDDRVLAYMDNGSVAAVEVLYVT